MTPLTRDDLIIALGQIDDVGATRGAYPAHVATQPGLQSAQRPDGLRAGGQRSRKQYGRQEPERLHESAH